MAANKFKFISPGIFLNEVDESQIPPAPEVEGPVIIGRFRKGPAMRPVKVRSYSEFVDVFGHPVPGNEGQDVWRSGQTTGPTYAAYAAKAWLNAQTAPATIVRTLGEDHLNKTSNNDVAGWTLGTTAAPADPALTSAANGGAYGLFVIDSGSFDTHNTGTLAAVWYLSRGTSMVMSGTLRGSRTGDLNKTGTYGLIKSTAVGNRFRTALYEGTTKVKDFEFDFDSNSGRYIRDVFNTNPIITNSSVVNSSNVRSGKNLYWLGETFERNVKEATTSTTTQFGFIGALRSGSRGGTHIVDWHDRQSSWANAETNWIFSQDEGAASDFNPPNTCTKLFKFHALDYGAFGNNLKVGIEDIRYSPNDSSPYGSFTVAVYPYGAKDKTAKHQALERFTRCNLNPNSPDFVEKRIGDKKLVWDYDQARHRSEGYYPNQSKYFRIEMNESVREGAISKRLLPFGFGGPIRPRGFSFFSGTVGFATKTPTYSATAHATNLFTDNAFTFITGGAELVYSLSANNSQNKNGVQVGARTAEGADHALNVGFPARTSNSGAPMSRFSGSWEFPTVQQRSSSVDGGNPGKDAYFGVHAFKSRTSTIVDEGYPDLVRGLPFSTLISDRHDGLSATLPNGTEYPWVFSLDDIFVNKATGADDGIFISGSRTGNSSETAISSSYKGILDYYDRFFVPMYGGFDGFDVTEAEPLRNSQLTVGTSTELNHYAFNTIDRAIKTVADPEVVECNIMTIPGITNDDLTDRLIDTAESRADTLAIVDIKDVFTPSTENTDSFTNNLGTVKTTVSNVQTRDINSSYACAYYPWIQAKDTRNDRLVWMPPSIVALGTFASSQAKTEVWFAPAGFTRGGLTEGSAGIPVVQVSERLTSKQRDSLYENNINPIAKFPSEGIVIFGQKTLQAGQSALDRINVRRLMIFVKKQVSRIAATILFDQNVPTTWARFTSQVNPFLASVQSRLGITEFKVVLDETTTTPDLIDRNILYAKIYIKPARAIEFIAIDFIITKTGASFDD